MKTYTIAFSTESKLDIAKLHHYISHGLHAPETAARYIDGLRNAIQRLASYAGSIAVSQNADIQYLCGQGARRINYKKRMAILYMIYDDDFVYIKRVIPGSLIR
ncbi:hypothetical protein Barb4_01773 [Bacteroidales bacterium Barb4]|nr:hypothetical protein Barb4_01773 [Bacteroidales bacterium Barb4]